MNESLVIAALSAVLIQIGVGLAIYSIAGEYNLYSAVSLIFIGLGWVFGITCNRGGE